MFIPPHPSRRLPGAFSLTELLVVIAIISLGLALIVPAIKSAQQKAQAAQCQSNLRQIGSALNLYRADNNNALPKVYDGGYYWFHQLLGVTPASQGANYLGSARLLACPSNPRKAPIYSTVPPTPVGFGMFDALLWYPTSHRSQDDPRFVLKVVKPSDWPLVMDGDKLAIYNLDSPRAEAAPDSRYAARHNNQANILMADGHIKQVAYGETRWNQSNLNRSASPGQ